MSHFKWTKTRTRAAIALADGETQQAAAVLCDISLRTVQRWCADPEFSAEVDRLTLMMGIAGRAERLRIVKKIVKQRMAEDGTIDSDKDILDLLKFAQSETDGIRLDLTALLEDDSPVADRRSTRAPGTTPATTDGPAD